MELLLKWPSSPVLAHSNLVAGSAGASQPLQCLVFRRRAARPWPPGACHPPWGRGACFWQALAGGKGSRVLGHQGDHGDVAPSRETQMC